MPHRSDDHDAEYAALLRQIRFSEYAETCTRSGILQATASELRNVARRLVRESLALRDAPASRRSWPGHAMPGDEGTRAGAARSD